MLRGFNYKEAFISGFSKADDGVQMEISNEHARSLIERKDKDGQIAYGIRHTPDANVKLFNSSKLPNQSIALSFTTGNDLYDDIFKIVRNPGGGYDLHLQKLNSVVFDGKVIDIGSLVKFL